MQEEHIKNSTKAFIFGISFILVAIVTYPTIGIFATGDIAEYSIVILIIILMLSALCAFIILFIAIIRNFKSEFIFPRTAKGWNRFAKPMMWLSATFIVAGLALSIHTVLFMLSAQPAEGTIIELIKITNDKGGITFKPVYTFIDADGQTNTITSSVSSNPPVGQTGDKIPVLYEPLDPSNARINRYFNLWGSSTVFGGLGTFNFIFFWVVFIVSKRKMKAA